MLLILLLASADTLLKAVPPPPDTVAAATKRCGEGGDTGAAKFHELREKEEEEMKKQAEAFAQGSTASPNSDEAKLLAPSPDETKAMMAAQQAMENARNGLADFETERTAAVQAARAKNTCKEGMSGCSQAWLKQLRKVQEDAHERVAKKFIVLWTAAKVAVEKNGKLGAPRQAKLAKGKSIAAQSTAMGISGMTAEGAKTLASLGSQACSAMTQFEE